MINNLKSIFVSAGYFIKLIFIPKKYDVVFVSSVVFNRGSDSENILFRPMIDCCKKNNLKYVIFEDTDLKGIFSNFNRSKEAMDGYFRACSLFYS